MLNAHHNICKTRREKSILAFGRIVVYYALLLSALHEGMLTLLVCLSSYFLH